MPASVDDRVRRDAAHLPEELRGSVVLLRFDEPISRIHSHHLMRVRLTQAMFDDGEDMEPGVNWRAAGDSGELAGIIARKRDAADWLALNRGAGETMKQHAPRLIAPQFLKALT